MDIESQKSRYREYIRRLTVGIEADDQQKLAAAYEKLRAANEQFFRNNAKTVGAEQASMLRTALEEVIHEHDTEIHVGQAFADVDFNADEEPVERHETYGTDEPEIAAAQTGSAEAVIEPEPAEALHEPETQDVSVVQDGMNETSDPEPATSLAGDQPVTIYPKVASPETPPAARPKAAVWLLSGAVLGLLAAGGIATALVSTGQIGILRDKQAIARNAAFESRFAADAPAIAPAIAYLREVEAAVVQRQQADANALAADFGRRFKELEDFDAELAKRQPKALPKGTRVVVKADAKGYKVMMQGPLCQAASFADPALVDPVRAPDGLGCTNLAVWNAEGAKF